MIGRASIGNPWFFNQVKHYIKYGVEQQKPTLAERVKVVQEHLDFSIRWKRGKSRFSRNEEALR